MKVYWDKIPRCFHFIALHPKILGRNPNNEVWAYIEKPNLWYCDTWNGWANHYEYRKLIEHEEYELDGTEDWKESLQERPNVCIHCGGKGSYEGYDLDSPDKVWLKLECDWCKGTGFELPKPKKCDMCGGKGYIQSFLGDKFLDEIDCEHCNGTGVEP